MKICGYNITEKLNDSSYTLVYRGVHEDSGKTAVLKLPKSTYPAPDALTRIRHEYDICSLFRHNKIISVLGLEEHEHKLVLIREDFDGVPLSSVQKTGSQDLVWFLDIAIQLTDGLREIHRKNIIYKNFCPENILYRFITGRIKLVDFSIASTAEDKPFHLSEKISPEGSLPYIAPEQTGRLGKTLDYRADFYSLGATLYHLLTGSLPFRTDDPFELLHCHIAKTPTAPSEYDPAIPPTVSRIILKLLEKSADNRYQSCDGLIPDLMKCMIELKNQQTIVDFSIGRKDISKEFSIPEKLYGRRAEIDKIIDICRDADDGMKKIILVNGVSGIGKTTLAREALKVLKERGGTIVNCKIDRHHQNIPYSSVIQGFKEMIQEILISDSKNIDLWKSTLLDATNSQSQIITEILPELELIIGQQKPVEQLRPAENKIRFNQVFLQFITGCSLRADLLIFFFDDLHWIDQESMELVKNVIQEPSISCMFIGTYRSNEKTGNQLFPFLEQIKNETVAVSTIPLEPLSIKTISHLLSESLFSPIESVTSLAEVCLIKTDGNPFFLKELLKELVDSGHLVFDSTNGRWNLSIDALREREVMHNVGKTLSQRIAGLPENTKNIIKLAACIGSTFNLSTIAALNRKSHQQTMHDLAETIQQGLILHRKTIRSGSIDEDSPQAIQPEELFQFSHDQIQQAAYDLIEKTDRHHFHLQVGRLLLQTATPDIKDQQIFTIASHCNHGIDLLKTKRERLDLAQLNLKAAIKAKNAAAYTSYYTFTQTGLKLLPEDIWDSDYPLALQLYNEAIEASSLQGLLTVMEDLFQVITTKTKCLLDKTTAYRIKIRGYIAANHLPEATRAGLEILAEMGIVFPEKPGRLSAIKAMLSTRLMLWGKNLESLQNIPEIQDHFQKTVMEFLHDIGSSAYYSAPNLLPLIGFTTIKLSLKYGNSITSAIVGYPTYGFLLCGLSPEKIEEGYRLGHLALKIGEKLGYAHNPRPLYLFNNLIAHWKNHISTTLPNLQKSYQLSLNCGDLETAANSAYSYSYRLFFLGYQLEDTAKELEYYRKEIQKFDQKIQLYRHLIFQQAVVNLRNQNDDRGSINGELYNSETMLPLHQKSNDKTTLFIFHLISLMQSYLFEKYQQAEEHGQECSRLIQSVLSSLFVPLYHFYYYMTLLERYPSVFLLKQNGYMQQVNSALKKMETWSHFSPDNYQHLYFLMVAEMSQIMNRKGKAADFYDKSISSARKNGYLREEALGFERTAHFYLKQRRTHLAKPYLIDALNCYRRWGANAKISNIEHKLKKLAQETDSVDQQPFFTNQQSPIWSHDDKTPWFDVMSVIKTSRTFAGEVVLGDLLKKLITILLENAGAQKAFLLLKIDHDWVVKAKAHINDNQGTLLEASPIIFRHQMSQTIINYVGRYHKTVVLNDACARGTFSNDNYILEKKPKSILCMPILHQGESIGILYLENNLTHGAFQPDRLEILNLIASQAAVSIRNSMLYEELEETIQKLNKEVGIRKETQIQLMHAGKLSALGRLSASIAHEFGNPLIGIKYLLDDLGNRISLSEEDRNLVKIGLDECERMKGLINDLHNLYRPSTGSRRQINLNNTAENVLLFQRKNLKNSRISVKTDLDPDLPLIRAVEDQITQAVVSLTINAADSMEENGGLLLVKTSHNSTHVTLEVTDTGCGIPTELQEHIFEPFFSTKEAIDGTGLGLAIAYSIITSHDGEISFSSTPRKGSSFRIELPYTENYDYQ